MIGHIQELTTSKDAWETVERLYTSNTKPRKIQLKNKMNNVKKTSSIFVNDYIIKTRPIIGHFYVHGHFYVLLTKKFSRIILEDENLVCECLISTKIAYELKKTWNFFGLYMLALTLVLARIFQPKLSQKMCAIFYQIP